MVTAAPVDNASPGGGTKPAGTDGGALTGARTVRTGGELATCLQCRPRVPSPSTSLGKHRDLWKSMASRLMTGASSHSLDDLDNVEAPSSQSEHPVVVEMSSSGSRLGAGTVGGKLAQLGPTVLAALRHGGVVRAAVVGAEFTVGMVRCWNERMKRRNEMDLEAGWSSCLV